MRPIQEFDAPSANAFREEILPLGQPAVLRGVAADWPLVAAARDGADGWMTMLSDWATAESGPVLRSASEVEGRFHYSKDGRALNFVREPSNLRGLVALLRQEAAKPRPDAIAAQGVLAQSVLPGFGESHPLPHAPKSAPPRLWIGNAAKVATHHDPYENIAVVVAGRRRFTLFPPDQVGNLYMGPLEFTPAGAPISMVHVTAPDLDKYPRFADALDAAQEAELGPGDAVFIPYAWYHHVESLDPANMLANYWWSEAPADIGSARTAMFHALLSIKALPPHQRAAWKAMFDHYVFQLDRDPAAHLNPEVAGVLGPITPQTMAAIRRALIDALTKDSGS